MLEIVTSVGGKTERFDLHNLPIGNTFVHKMGQTDLYRELAALKVPNIAATDGWQQLAIAYGRYRQSKPLPPLVDHRPVEAKKK